MTAQVDCTPACTGCKVSDADSLALVAMYNATDGANWVPRQFGRQSTACWLSGPVSTWYGITILPAQPEFRVTLVSLSAVGMKGELPEQLADLSELKTLGLSDDGLTGEIPSFIQTFQKLEWLHLEASQFHGSIPTWLGNMTSLTSLSLAGNQLTGSIPAELGALVNLTRLVLFRNQLTGSIPAELGNLSNLQTLHLHFNQLTGAIPTSLGSLSMLKDLELQKNTLGGAVPEEIKNLANLEYLFLNENELEDLPNLTGGLVSLKGLYLNQNRFTFEDLEPNASFTSLNTFSYTGQAVVDTWREDKEDGSIELSVEVGGTQTTYQWYKDGVPIPNATGSTYTLSAADGSVYRNVSQNPLLPGLFLASSVVEAEARTNVFIVNTIADDPDGDLGDTYCDTGSAGSALTGLCTLRAAIQTANAEGAGNKSRITFNVPGDGIPAIHPTSALPPVLFPVEIDGTTQGQAGRIELSGDMAGSDVDGLVVEGGASLVRGVEINRFSGHGLVLRTQGGNTIENTFLGTDSQGREPAGNGKHGLWIDAIADNTIGGSGDAKRNGISANTGHGILVSGETANQNVFHNNLIGVATDKSTSLGNGGAGIFLQDASDNEIGGDDLANANVIRHNGEAGVSVVGPGTGNTIRKNVINGNIGLAIDLGADGMTGNDLGDGLPASIDLDEGPNHLVNFPVGITVAEDVQEAGKIILLGVVDKAYVNAKVDLYLSSSVGAGGRGEADSFFKTVEPNEEGVFFALVTRAQLTKPFISATLTDAGGSTSEFSPVCLGRAGSDDVDGDGDGLCDDWEENGLDYDGDGIPDLTLHEAPFSADPTKKDLFVEIDYMDGHNERLLPDALADVTAAFANRGIELHLMEDEELPHVDVVRFLTRDPDPRDDFDDLKKGNPFMPCGTGDTDGHFGTESDRNSANCAAILGARRLVFRYAIFGHQFKENLSSSGISELPGNDFMVTLGNWADASIMSSGASQDLELARRRVQAGTLMHEFGHSLYLRHGGGDHDNCKPNYPSIMSYSLQFPKYISDRLLDYSSWEMAPLDKTNLNERDGLNGPATRKIVYWKSTGVGVRARTDRVPIDWDGLDSDHDGNQANDIGVVSDINYGGNTACRGNGVVLASYDDWANLQYNFRISTDFGDGDNRDTTPIDEPEITEEMAIEDVATFDYDGDGFANAVDNCPAYADPDQTDLDGNGIGDVCEQPVNELILQMKSSSDEVKPNQHLVYHLTVYSIGPDASSVTLENLLDPRVELVSVEASAGTCSESTNTIQCELGEMALDDSVSVTITVTSDIEAQIENAATVSSPIFDPDPADNEVTIFTTVAVASGEMDTVPKDYLLEQNYPNPFNPYTTVSYSLPVPGHVTVTILDLLGRPIRTIVDETQSSGRHTVQFDASDLSSGVYLYRLVSGGYSTTRRMVLLK